MKILLLFIIFIINLPANASAECKQFNEYKNDFASTCWPCEIFEDIINTLGGLADASFAAIAEPLAFVLIVMTTLWLLMQTMFAFININSGNAVGYIATIMRQLFRVAFVVAILKFDPDFLFEYILSPVLIGGMEFANQAFGGECAYNFNETASGIFPQDLKIALVCIIDKIHQSVSDTMAVSSSLLCLGSSSTPIVEWFPFNFVRSITMIIQGAILHILATILIITASVKLLNGILKLGFLGIMIPILAVAWVFEISRSYVNNGVKIIIYSTTLFIFILLMLNLGTEVLRIAMPTAQIMNYFNNGQVNEIEREFGLFSVSFGQFLIAYLLVFMLLGKAPELANNFAGAEEDVVKGFTLQMIRNARVQLAAAKAGALKFGGGLKRLGVAGGGAIKRAISR